ncbi:MAG: MotA/TolQ/ExbB proton channel family protein [Candidatus Omnitrophica bacterium]|nr:MotA/TolQ/ExbB proton channel family protein [Candidatus Omnitrophota bacterium]
MWQTFLKGGPIMWPILLCSIFAMAIIIERSWYLHRIKIDTRIFLKKILERLKARNLTDALNVCRQSSSPIAYILKAGIEKHIHLSSQAKEVKFDERRLLREDIKEAMEEASLFVVPDLEKNMTTLATLAHISPLLGLLGTVTGILHCFQAIQFRSSGANPVSPGYLAGGIWEALLTTVAGLTVAIPAFVAYNYLVNRISRFTLEMERVARELVNFLTE